MQDPPPEKDANEQEVSLQSILNAIQSHSEQTSAAIKQINEGIRRLMKSTKAIYEGNLHQDGLYRVVVDPNEEKAEADGNEEILYNPS